MVIDLLQSQAALRRAAREAVEGLAGDGVVYAELRFAPVNHSTQGSRQIRYRRSDDRAIATTTVGREYEVWRSVHRFSNAELWGINRRAVEATFCDTKTERSCVV